MIGKIFIFLFVAILTLANGDCGTNGEGCACGKANKNKMDYYYGMAHPRAKRAFGSRRSKEGDWPWAVMLQFPDKACSGSIVGKKWILTAQSCIGESTASQTIVFLGHPTITSMNSTKAEMIHKLGNFKAVGENYENDLALIELKTELTFNDSVHSICIMKDLKPDEKEIAVFAGYGRPFYYIKNQSLVEMNGQVIPPEELFMTNAESLQETPIALQPWGDCKMNASGTRINSTTACGGKTAHGTTDGDAGGPLMLIRDNKWVLFGVASTGRYESIGGDRLAMDHYGLYTKVGQYCDWLKTTTKDAVTCGA
uniref:Peptidase S1 domain-containing protein n=1 Tax=Panagrolaimus sp. JU765 TaxID=591449 RepID=A0AC34R0D3_9BILA